jgi:uncharacterized protein (DUF2062 family)
MPLKEKLFRLIHESTHPREFAFASALGVFIGLLIPIFGLHTIIVLILAFIFKLNKPAVLLGAMVGQPFILAPVFFLSIKIGETILGHELSGTLLVDLRSKAGFFKMLSDVRSNPGDYFSSLVLGNVIIAIVIFLLVYIIVLNVAKVVWRGKHSL